MAYKGISLVICGIMCLLISCYVEAGISKISFKKSIEGTKEKYQNKIKLDFGKSTTATTITIGTTTELDATTGSTLTVTPAEEKTDLISTTTALPKDIPSSSSTSVPSSSVAVQDSTTEFKPDTTTTSTNIVLSTTTNTNTIATTTTTTTSQEDNSCTCGIFLSSQFVKGSPKPPTGEPVISNILDHTFSCNPIGQRKCQTKCLEHIVQHLPNSATILCAALDRDIKKERAYLFIKNCSNQWHNTNLAAGREYCCKNGQPYKCTK